MPDTLASHALAIRQIEFLPPAYRPSFRPVSILPNRLRYPEIRARGGVARPPLLEIDDRRPTPSPSIDPPSHMRTTHECIRLDVAHTAMAIATRPEIKPPAPIRPQVPPITTHPRPNDPERNRVLNHEESDQLVCLYGFRAGGCDVDILYVAMPWFNENGLIKMVERRTLVLVWDQQVSG